MQQLQQTWPQEELQVSRHSLFMFLLFSTCVHHFLECLGFTWYLLVVVHMLPIPQHGVFKDFPSFVTIYTPQGLVVKVTCLHHGWIVKLAMCRPRAILASLNLCTTWLNPKAWALLPGSCIAVPLLFVLKTWLFKDAHGCCHEHPNFVPVFVPNKWLSVL
jgi:hypothetical protein